MKPVGRQHTKADGTAKKGFDSEEAALKHLDSIGRGFTVNIYQCNICDKYHTSSNTR